MINDNPKPNKVDMRGIQRKGPGGDDAYDGLVFFLFIIAFVVVAFGYLRQKSKINNNTHTIDCKTKVAPKI